MKLFEILTMSIVLGLALAVLFELAYIEYTLHVGFEWTELSFGEWYWNNTIGRYI